MNRDGSSPAGGESEGTDLPPGASFEILEHTADVGILARGRDHEGLFAAAASALFSLITDPARVRPVRERSLTVEADTPEELLHDWLEELNTLHQIHREFYARFELRVEPGRVRARVLGEPIDPERHDLRLEVKAVTWHGLSVLRTGDGWEARVLLDI